MSLEESDTVYTFKDLRKRASNSKKFLIRCNNVEEIEQIIDYAEKNNIPIDNNDVQYYINNYPDETVIGLWSSKIIIGYWDSDFPNNYNCISVSEIADLVIEEPEPDSTPILSQEEKIKLLRGML